MLPACRPERVVADLRELAELTGGPGGARRVAWTEPWREARAWLCDKLAELPAVTTNVDAAGNLWATLPGAGSGSVIVGSHLDSVPAGGWLDGALGVVAGLELMRCRSGGARPPVALRLVDWADEEGARFGRSLFGSTAAAGRLDPDALREAHDGSVSVEEALRRHGVELDRANDARAELDGALAYLEIHVEQGPVLERRAQPVAVVDGCSGVERNVVELTGEAAHAGAAPMDMRRDPVVVASRAIDHVFDLAEGAAATATVGRIAAEPGVVTIVPERVELTLDLRHREAKVLARLLEQARTAFARAADSQAVTVAWHPQWRIDPIPFDAELVGLARAACAETGLEPFVMTSGALHDAAAVAAEVPTVMLLVPSRRGISHSAAEDTAEDDLHAGVRALDALLERTLAQAAHGR